MGGAGESRERDDWLLHSLLFETGPDGRFTHLELARPDRLATLHPEGDGTLHGNHVGSDPGGGHLAGWPSPRTSMIVDGSPVSLAAIAWGPSRCAGGRVPAS